MFPGVNMHYHLEHKVVTFYDDFTSRLRDIEQFEGHDKHCTAVPEGYGTLLVDRLITTKHESGATGMSDLTSLQASVLSVATPYTRLGPREQLPTLSQHAKAKAAYEVLSAPTLI